MEKENHTPNQKERRRSSRTPKPTTKALQYRSALQEHVGNRPRPTKVLTSDDYKNLKLVEKLMEELKEKIMAKQESTPGELEDKLRKENQQKQEAERSKRKREEEVAQALMKVDEEAAAKANSQRELGSQLGDVVEEKEARNKAEKQKIDLNEELEVEVQVIEGG